MEMPIGSGIPTGPRGGTHRARGSNILTPILLGVRSISEKIRETPRPVRICTTRKQTALAAISLYIFRHYILCINYYCARAK